MYLAYALVLSATCAAGLHDFQSSFSAEKLAVRDAAKSSLEERAPGNKCHNPLDHKDYNNQDKFCQGKDLCLCNNGALECGKCKERVRFDCDCGKDQDGNISCYKEDPGNSPPRFECLAN
ncbi:hypothetical protein EJ03DRAFT_324342 [Teratosphaeria nubilosa]|uniref:Uncharacterized protein n=1 Tax=Teratosphaeria nubilosa TaxID=161662 RepID=A0A6G1LJP4_9PEZI|nr:hypothetical protein EJ03DRAFT_324342 [Teratosphaeria nubilosa]